MDKVQYFGSTTLIHHHRNTDGTIEKDPTVEFDSDEEPPSPPPGSGIEKPKVKG
jgi:hypothetical protein